MTSKDKILMRQIEFVESWLEDLSESLKDVDETNPHVIEMRENVKFLRDWIKELASGLSKEDEEFDQAVRELICEELSANRVLCKFKKNEGINEFDVVKQLEKSDE
jgi:mannitol/fructose-specific phosphotransferase system IIA component